MVVTHPYHPLHGQAFPFYSCVTTGGVRLVRCVRDDQTLLSLPIAWTNYRRQDPFEEASAGRSLLRADDLGALRALVDRLLERSQKHGHK